MNWVFFDAAAIVPAHQQVASEILVYPIIRAGIFILFLLMDPDLSYFSTAIVFNTGRILLHYCRVTLSSKRLHPPRLAHLSFIFLACLLQLER